MSSLAFPITSSWNARISSLVFASNLESSPSASASAPPARSRIVSASAFPTKNASSTSRDASLRSVEGGGARSSEARSLATRLGRGGARATGRRDEGAGETRVVAAAALPAVSIDGS